MKHSKKQNNSEKITKKELTIFPHGFNLSPALESQTANQRVFKKIIGGKVDTTRPPAVCGFFMPANFSGGNISLPGGCEIKYRLCGNTCSASYDALEDSRQPYSCQYFIKSIGKIAMKDANTHGTASPEAAKQGENPTQCNHCLIPSCVVSYTLNQAQEIAANSGKSGTPNAYAELLEHFHAATFPTFIEATGGNISQLARLLGLDRSSVRKYVDSIGLSHLIGRNAQSVAKSGGAA